MLNYRSVFLTKVKHSQRMNDSSLMPEVIANKDGSVISGLGTWMARIGDVCSHVGVLLFVVEAAEKIRDFKFICFIHLQGSDLVCIQVM